MQYTMDYQDRYPIGFTFAKFNPNTGRPTDAGNSGYITWFSLIDQYLTSAAGPTIPLDANSGFFDGATTRNFHAAFKCPSVSSNYQQKIHYYQHPVIMPHLTAELPSSFRGSQPAISPAKINQLYPNTALLWDTPLFTSATPFTPTMFWFGGGVDTISGFALPVSRVDGGQLNVPSAAELRFRGPGRDRFISSTNALLNPAGPILWASDALLQQTGSFSPTWNADSLGGTIINFTVGGPRWRHTGNGCNVLFADGSVRTLYLHPSRKVADGPVGTGSADYIDSDFRRYMLMIKWPPGAFDSQTVPTNGG
jgi:prepilin-type processing-associated H-X9-DG protein